MGIEAGRAPGGRRKGQRANSAGRLGGLEDLQIAVEDAARRLIGVSAEKHRPAVGELDLPRVPAAGVHLGLFGPLSRPGVEVKTRLSPA